MQISENDAEVEDALLCRELTNAEVLVIVEALGLVRAAHLASKFDSTTMERVKGTNSQESLRIRMNSVKLCYH